MLDFYAHRFFNISSTLAILEHTLTNDDGVHLSPTPQFCAEIAKHLANICKECTAAGLVFSVYQIERIAITLDQPDMEVIRQADLAGQIQALSVRIQDELQSMVCLIIPREREQYYANPRDKFGKSILDKFPSIVQDVESAGKCYATGNATATVFHLMRIMEVGLRALGHSLGDPTLDPSRNPNWQTMLQRCDEELKRPLKDRSSKWKDDDQFYSEAVANIRAVKDAWRNPTMHIQQVYDNYQALAVFNAVQAFMRQLSTKL